MVIKYFLQAFFYLAIIILPASCSKAHYIPDLGGEWKNTASAVTDSYYFNADQGGAYQSDFTGNESVNFSSSYEFSGSYENTKIHFTFSTGPNSGVTYSGTISGSGNSSVMTLSTPTGQIILTR